MASMLTGSGRETDLSNMEGVSNASMRPVGQHPPRRLGFDSREDMLRFINDTKRFWPWNNKVSDETYTAVERVAAFGTATWDEALTLARNGWPDGRSLLIKTRARELTPVRQRVRARVYDVAGGVPDVARFVAGDPFCMEDVIPADDGRKPTIRLCISPNCDFGVTQQRRANWGAALLSWIDAEETAGFQVELSVLYVTVVNFMFTEDRLLAPPLVVSFRLKEASEEIPIAELAFWIMHNAAHRRIQFAVKERMDVGAWYNRNKVHGEPVIDEIALSGFAPEESVVVALNSGAASVQDGLDQIDRSVAAWRARREAAA